MPWNTAGNIKGPKGDKGDPGNAADIAALIHAATTKTPADADELPILDSGASWALRKFTWASLKTALQSVFYHRGNILGTVSQSSGVPTGAIIQRGSNANGEFVRFADGTQICFSTVSVSPGNIAANSTTAFGSTAFAASFASVPFLCVVQWGGPYVESIYGAASWNASSVSTYGRNLSATALSWTGNVTVYITTIGRWY